MIGRIQETIIKLNPRTPLLSALVAFPLALAPSGAQARSSQWWYVAQGADRVLYVDVETIERKGDVVTYAMSQVLRDPENPAALVRGYMTNDCAKREETWDIYLRYGADDERLDETALSHPGPEAVVDGTIGSAQMDFVCAADRSETDGFPLAIDEVAFAEALIADTEVSMSPAARHEQMLADPKVPVIRSSAPGPETFGTVQSATAGHAVVPPRDYAKGIGIPVAQEYDAIESGTIYDIAYMGITDGQLVFEQRGYTIDDLAHASSAQAMNYPVDTKSVEILDIGIEILEADDKRLRYRAQRIQRDTGQGL